MIVFLRVTNYPGSEIFYESLKRCDIFSDTTFAIILNSPLSITYTFFVRKKYCFSYESLDTFIVPHAEAAGLIDANAVFLQEQLAQH